MRFGYARVSTPKQSLESQIFLLKEAGCEKIFSDIMTGAKFERPEFGELLTQLRKEDTVFVTGIDRLGRSTKHLIQLLEEFHKRDIHLVILGHDLDTRTPYGRMLFNLLAVFAENDRMLKVERIKRAQEAARKKGRLPGRKKSLTEEQAQRMGQIYNSKTLSVKEICLMYQITKPTMYSYLKGMNS